MANSVLIQKRKSFLYIEIEKKKFLYRRHRTMLFQEVSNKRTKFKLIHTIQILLTNKPHDLGRLWEFIKKKNLD